MENSNSKKKNECKHKFTRFFTQGPNKISQKINNDLQKFQSQSILKFEDPVFQDEKPNKNQQKKVFANFFNQGIKKFQAKTQDKANFLGNQFQNYDSIEQFPQLNEDSQHSNNEDSFQIKEKEQENKEFIDNHQIIEQDKNQEQNNILNEQNKEQEEQINEFSNQDDLLEQNSKQQQSNCLAESEIIENQNSEEQKEQNMSNLMKEIQDQQRGNEYQNEDNNKYQNEDNNRYSNEDNNNYQNKIENNQQKDPWQNKQELKIEDQELNQVLNIQIVADQKNIQQDNDSQQEEENNEQNQKIRDLLKIDQESETLNDNNSQNEQEIQESEPIENQNQIYISEVIPPPSQYQIQQSQYNRNQQFQLSQLEKEKQERILEAQRKKAYYQAKLDKINKFINPLLQKQQQKKQNLIQQQQPVKKMHLLQKQKLIFEDSEKQAQAQNLVKRMNLERRKRQEKQLRKQSELDNFLFNRLPMLSEIQTQIKANYDSHRKIPQQLKELRLKQEEIYNDKLKGKQLKYSGQINQKNVVQQKENPQYQSIDESLNKYFAQQSQREDIQQQEQEEVKDYQDYYLTEKKNDLVLPQIPQSKSMKQYPQIQDEHIQAIQNAKLEYKQKQEEIQKQIKQLQREEQMKQKQQMENFKKSLEKQQREKMIQDLDKSFKMKLQKEKYYQPPEVQQESILSQQQRDNSKHQHYISNLNQKQNPDFSAQLNSFQDQSSFMNSELMRSQMRAMGKIDYNWPRDIMEEDELQSQRKQLQIQELNLVKQRHVDSKQFSENLRQKEKRKQQRIIMRIEQNKQKMLEEQLLREKHGTQFNEIEDPRQWDNLQEQLEQISNIMDHENQEQQEQEANNNNDGNSSGEQQELIMQQQQQQQQKQQLQQRSNQKKQIEPEIQLETEEKQHSASKNKKKSGKKGEAQKPKIKSKDVQVKTKKNKPKQHTNSEQIENILQEFDNDESKP